MNTQNRVLSALTVKIFRFCGRLGLILKQQAVYPLAATKETLQSFGISDREIPVGAHLLVLGQNCD